RRHRRAAGHRLEHHQPEGLAGARKHEHIGAAVDLHQLGARNDTTPVNVRILALHALEQGADAIDEFGARQVELQKRLEILFVGDPADKEKHRARQSEIDVGHRLEQAQVDAMRPASQIGEAVRLENRKHANCRLNADGSITTTLWTLECNAFCSLSSDLSTLLTCANQALLMWSNFT